MAALIAVHVAVIVHVAHWKISGRTLTPVEPSEAMQTLELGYVNAGFVLFAVLILATLVLGRFFCGWACHVVAYQDLCAWMLGRIGLRPKPVRSRLLVFVPLGAAFYMFIWPQIARLFEGRSFPPLISHLTTDSFWATFPGPGIAALTLLVDGFLIVYLLGAKGFCTYGCPYGAFFGVADRFAPGKIRVTDACEQCGHCTKTCTSNVRVNEEVAKFGMVVDAGCMKCLDCVSVCPKDALYFGFGAPSAAAPKKNRSRRQYDFTWGEELVMAGAFLFSAYAYRGLYNAIPLLLAIGLAVMFAVGAVIGWRLITERSLTVQHHDLRRDGRLTRAGFTAALIVTLLTALTAHSAYVQFQTREGKRLFLSAREAPPAARGALLDHSVERLERADRFGLFGNVELLNLLGAANRDRGDVDGALRYLHRAIEVDPTVAKYLTLSTLLAQRQQWSDARTALLRLLELEPDHPEAKRRLQMIDAR